MRTRGIQLPLLTSSFNPQLYQRVDGETQCLSKGQIGKTIIVPPLFRS